MRRALRGIIGGKVITYKIKPAVIKPKNTFIKERNREGMEKEQRVIKKGTRKVFQVINLKKTSPREVDQTTVQSGPSPS